MHCLALTAPDRLHRRAHRSQAVADEPGPQLILQVCTGPQHLLGNGPSAVDPEYQA